MKLIKATTIALLLIAITQTATAVNYNANNCDLLLAFRKTGSKDMVWDVGNVSNYLNVAAGNTITVTGYNTNQVYTNFTSSFSGVLFTLFATTGDSDSLARMWMTDTNMVNVPANLTVNQFSTLNGKTTGVGNAASQNTANNSATAWVDASSDANSYSSIVSPGDSSSISVWGGDAPFVVEAASSGTMNFYQMRIDPSASTPGKLIGTFTMAASGVITFTATGGAVPLSPATITGVTSGGSTRTIFFTTTNSANYRLVYATGVTNSMGTNGWTQLPGSVVGDGTVKNLSDTSADPKRFYKVQTY